MTPEENKSADLTHIEQAILKALKDEHKKAEVILILKRAGLVPA